MMFWQSVTVIIFLVCVLVFAWMQKPRLFWVGFALTAEGALGGWEWLSCHYHGITLSETFGRMGGWLSLTILSIGLIALIAHLIIWKFIAKKEKNDGPKLPGNPVH